MEYNFNSIYSEDTISNRVINLYASPTMPIANSDRLEFAMINFDYFSEDQKLIVKKYILSDLGICNDYFLRLIELYRIHEYDDYLKANSITDFDSIFEKLSAGVRIGSFKDIPDATKTKLLCTIIWINLNDDKMMEDILIASFIKITRRLIKEAMQNKSDFNDISERLRFVYSHLFDTTLGRLRSKSALIKSLELVDIPDVFYSTVDGTIEDRRYYYWNYLFYFHHLIPSFMLPDYMPHYTSGYLRDYIDSHPDGWRKGIRD